MSTISRRSASLERLEDHHLVDAVEELRPEVALHGLHHHLAPGGPVEVGVHQVDAAEVAGHDDDRVAEVHGAALAIGEAAIVEHLQEHVEDVGVGLLDLVEEHDGVRPPADRLGELAALVVADVARRRADQPRDRVLLHVLAHVDADHRPLVVEQELGERARQLRLPDAGGARGR